jgi:hypothetical protein
MKGFGRKKWTQNILWLNNSNIISNYGLTQESESSAQGMMDETINPVLNQYRYCCVVAPPNRSRYFGPVVVWFHTSD